MTADGIAVREATTDDVEAIVDVARDSWFAAYGGFLDPDVVEQAIREYYDPDLVASAVEHDDIAFFVADAPTDADAPTEAGGERDVVGFASAEQTWADEVELHTIYVHPDRWGAGVGTALLDRVEAWARDQGVDRIACAVFAENAVGTGFVEARGFERGMEAEGEVVGRFHPEVEFELEL